jgi:hypothetical protein
LGERRNEYKILAGELERKIHSEGLDLGERIILKCTLEK